MNQLLWSVIEWYLGLPQVMMRIDKSRTDDLVPARYHASLGVRRGEILADFCDFVSLDKYIVVFQHYNMAIVMSEDSSVLQ